MFLRSFAKQRNVLAFFSVLCKRTLRSLCSFLFFAKERCVLCVLFLFLEKNKNLLGLISGQKLEKRTERMERSFLRREKNGMYRTEKNGVPNPDYMYCKGLQK